MPSPAILLPAGLLLLAPVLASPLISYPMNLQLPPALIRGNQYSYQLPVDTFTSPVSSVEYSVAGLPSWLSFDSKTRSFSGSVPKPSSNDQSNDIIWFDLIGSDTSGETRANSSLLITNANTTARFSSTQELQENINTTLSFTSTDSLALESGQQFRIEFPANLFNKNQSISYYSALTASHTPLPIWLQFDPTSFVFSGTAPSVSSDIAPSENYQVALLAVQADGFSVAQYSFTLTLGAHPFTTNLTFVNQTVTPGANFIYHLPFDAMLLNGTTVTEDNISDVSLNSTQSWLSANKTAVFGTVPKDFNTTTNYLVTITNTYKDSVSCILSLQANSTKISTGIFQKLTSDLSVNATAGDYFQYQLPSSLIVDKNANFSANYSDNQPWLNFHPKNTTFNGLVPKSFSGTDVTVVGKDQDVTQSLKFTLKSVSATSTKSTTTSSAPSPTLANENSTPESTSQPSSSSSRKKLVTILCSVLIPVGVILIAALILLLFCCCKRRKSSRNHDYEKGKVSPSSSSNSNHRHRKLKSWSRNKPRPIISSPRMLPGGGNNDNHRIVGSRNGLRKDENSGTGFIKRSDTSKRGSSLTSMDPTHSPFLMKTPNPNHSRRSSLDTLNNPNTTPKLLSYEQKYGTPTMMNEYNMQKLDNPSKYFAPGTFGMSPASIPYSEANSSDVTVGPDGSSSPRTYTDAFSERYTVENSNSPFLANNNNLNRTISKPEPAHFHQPNTSAFGIAISGEHDFDAVGKPRNSWRQTSEPAQSWHSRQPDSSLATIYNEDSKSVRLVGEIGKQQNVQSKQPRVRSFIADVHQPSPSSSNLNNNDSKIKNSESHSSLGSGSHSNGAVSPILKPIGSISSSPEYNHQGHKIYNNNNNILGHAHGPSVVSDDSNSTSLGSYSSTDSDEPIRTIPSSNINNPHIANSNNYNRSNNNTGGNRTVQPPSILTAAPTLNTAPQQPFRSTAFTSEPQRPPLKNFQNNKGRTAFDALTNKLSNALPKGLSLPGSVTGETQDQTTRTGIKNVGKTIQSKNRKKNTGDDTHNLSSPQSIGLHRSMTNTSVDMTDMTDAYRTASSGESCYEDGGTRHSIVHRSGLRQAIDNQRAKLNLPKKRNDRSDIDSEGYFSSSDEEEDHRDVLHINQGRWTIVPSKKANAGNVVYGQAIDTDIHRSLSESSPTATGRRDGSNVGNALMSSNSVNTLRFPSQPMTVRDSVTSQYTDRTQSIYSSSSTAVPNINVLSLNPPLTPLTPSAFYSAEFGSGVYSTPLQSSGVRETNSDFRDMERNAELRPFTKVGSPRLNRSDASLAKEELSAHFHEAQ